jgi:hypothetical protein
VSILRSDGTERGVARVAGFKAVEAASEFGGEPGFIDFEMLQDGRQVAVAGIQEFHQIVFDFDVIMRTRQAESRRGFHRIPRRVIQFSD